jgi:predicted RNA-binding protein
MCQATVYLERDGDRELVMDEVANLWIEGDTVWMSQFLEEAVAVRAAVKAADFLDHVVLLVALEDAEGGT